MTGRSPREGIYDRLAAVDAVTAAWTRPGPNPEYHRRMQAEVRQSMPVLARALDRLARERRNR